MTKMFWDPNTGEPTVYEDDQTPPDGHLDTHPDNVKGSTATKASPTQSQGAQQGGNDPLDKPLTRTETIAALTQGGIQYDNKATAIALHDLLRGELLTALHDREVQGVDELSTRRLLIEVEK